MLLKENMIVTFGSVEYVILERTHYMGTDYYLCARPDKDGMPIRHTERIIYENMEESYPLLEADDYDEDYFGDEEDFCFVGKESLEALLRLLFEEQMTMKALLGGDNG